jgi:hypothetical protein
MKKLKKVIAGCMLLFLGGTPAQASDFELLKTTYLTIYSVVEFMELNELIEDACQLADGQTQQPRAYTSWRQQNSEALQSIMQIKSLYEARAIRSGGERVKKAFEDQQMIIYTQAVKTTMPFYKGTAQQVSTACRNWTLTMDTENAQYKAQVNAEVAFIVNRKAEIIAAINNPENW